MPAPGGLQALRLDFLVRDASTKPGSAAGVSLQSLSGLSALTSLEIGGMCPQGLPAITSLQRLVFQDGSLQQRQTSGDSQEAFVSDAQHALPMTTPLSKLPVVSLMTGLTQLTAYEFGSTDGQVTFPPSILQLRNLRLLELDLLVPKPNSRSSTGQDKLVLPRSLSMLSSLHCATLRTNAWCTVETISEPSRAGPGV